MKDSINPMAVVRTGALLLIAASASTATFEVPSVGAGMRVTPASAQERRREPVDPDDDGRRVADIVHGGDLDADLAYVNGRIFSVRLVGELSSSGGLEERLAVYDVSEAGDDPTKAVGRTFPLRDADVAFRLRQGGHEFRLVVAGDRVALLGPWHGTGSQFQERTFSVADLREQRHRRGLRRAESWPSTVKCDRGECFLSVPQYAGRLCTQFLTKEDGRLIHLDCSVEPWWKTSGAADDGLEPGPGPRR